MKNSLTSGVQICDLTNIDCVAIENPQLSLEFWQDFTAIVQILVALHIPKLEV
jgi:hypothetical protein